MKALALCRKAGDRTNDADMLALLGTAGFRQGRHEQATSHLQRALTLSRQTIDMPAQAAGGHRAIYHDGWRAVCPWPGPSFTEAGKGFGQPISVQTLSELDATGWELYHVAEDFAENHNVAAEHRDRLIAMIGTWYVEAGKYGVMPVDGSGLARMIAGRPLVAARCPQAGQAHAQVRVRADRAARHATRQRSARAAPALRGR